MYFKLVFYVDESVPFEETSHFACTGALVPGTATTSIFQPGRMDKHFTCTRSVFFGCPARVSAGLAPARFRGSRQEVAKI